MDPTPPTGEADLTQEHQNQNQTQTQQQHQTHQQHHQHQQHQQQIWMQQHQQQWMGAQYLAAAMAMMQQQMMMYPQQYVPYSNGHAYHQQQTQLMQTQDEIKTIWVGDLHHWMDENYLGSCFAHSGEVVSVKLIRNKQTGISEGYGFIEFYSRTAAENVLQNYSGTMMPNTEQPFRLNWAAFSAGERRSEGPSDLSVFVGDLASDVTDAILQETFASRYPSVKGAKVVIDSNTGQSKGYGFVRFSDECERSRAMTEMNGEYCSNRPMRVGVATPKKVPGYQQQYSSQALVVAGGHGSNGYAAQPSQPDSDSNNTTIFVGGLDSELSDEDLRQAFSKFGDVTSVKIPVGKGCGFVQFANRQNAEEAIQQLNGTVLGNQTVHLSWGRNQGNKQWRADHGSQWNGGYGGQGYGGYGYAAQQNQEAGMYASNGTS